METKVQIFACIKQANVIVDGQKVCEIQFTKCHYFAGDLVLSTGKKYSRVTVAWENVELVESDVDISKNINYIPQRQGE